MKINNSIKNKFVFSLTLVILIFVIAVASLSYYGAKKELEKSVRNNLSILSKSIYQTMTNSMLSGTPEVVQDAEKQATTLPGIKHLQIAKSKQIIQNFGLNEPFTTDPEILKVFLSKKEHISEINGKNHEMKILKPFIAKQKCLSCHVSAKPGDVLGVMDLRVSLDESDRNIAFFTRMISLSNIFLALVLIAVVLFLLHKMVTKPLQNLIGIIKELSTGSRDLTKRVTIKSDDELGTIADNFNRYLDQIEENYRQDRKFITEAKKTIDRAKQGYYDEIITATPQSPTLNDFKNSVNEMLTATKKNFEQLNTVLEEYAKHNYNAQLHLENIDKNGAFAKLVEHINQLKTVITEMLIENKNTSLKLNRFSDILLENVASVTKTTTYTESSLQQVNDALSQITENIIKNTHNVTQMAKLADNVTDSAKQGEALATQTVGAMDAINEQVSEINEAISVIDQIAFQTNILSLNAAVEAATAGEAGKGFAVVASEVRNLASKSAEAAHKIKELVELATCKTNDGKEIAHEMIEGYHRLIHNISDTVQHIHDIKQASQAQSQTIEKINHTVSEVTERTKINAKVTKQTQEVALQTDKMARYAVKKIDEKEFEGKESLSLS
jgi:methyl-accepting chemotaxis protein